MKIYSVEQIRNIDNYTIEHEPIASIHLMEHAALSCVSWLIDNFNANTHYFIFCGKGNNGGDGLAITRILLKNNFKATAFVFSDDKRSADNALNLNRLTNEFHNSVINLQHTKQLEDIDFYENTLVIDALLGTGVNSEIIGIYKDTIDFLNSILLPKIAIDIPSGLYADSLSVQQQTIFRSNYTLTFQFPKLSFLFSENYAFVGEFFILDIQLNDTLYHNESAHHYYITQNDVEALEITKSKFDHKGKNGHALLIAGSNNKSGAAILASKAAIKSGCGLVTLASSQQCINALQTHLPEVMSITAGADPYISELPKLEHYSAIAIGPGIGLEKQTANVLKLLIQEVKTPLVIDADAITILSENKTWLSFLPGNCIFTPHVKELERLIGKCSNSFERLEKTKQFTQKHNCIVIIKGAHSAIVAPHQPVYFNSTGNSALAKGGSGDVLTGLITGLLAQGHNPLHASLIAVFKHGKAADLLIQQRNFNTILPSNLCDYF